MTGFSLNTLGNGTTLLLFLGQGSLDSESFVRRHGEEQIQLRAGEQRREKKGSQHLDFRFLASRIGEGNGNPLQCSCLENPREGGAWWAAIYGISQSQTRLSDFPFTFHFHALEKEMATLSSVLAWRIPGTGESGGLPSKESHRVGHD